jgi:uncharacterized protein YeaO (DUF488 family)
MVLKECSFNSHVGWSINPNPYMTNSKVEFVQRNCNHKLSPTYPLINEFKGGHIGWYEFASKFKSEMDNEICKRDMRRIKELSKENDVYLICSCSNNFRHCHRFILLDLINNME